MPGGQMVATRVRNGGWCVARSAPPGASRSASVISGRRGVRLPRRWRCSRRARRDDAQPGEVVHLHGRDELDPVAGEHRNAVAVPSVSPVVVPGQRHDGHGERFEEASEPLVLRVPVVVGEVALHHDELGAPRQGLVEGGAGAARRVRLRSVPNAVGRDAGPPPEPMLADVHVADRGDATELGAGRRAEGADRLGFDPGERHTDFGVGFETVDDRRAAPAAFDHERGRSRHRELVRSWSEVAPTDLDQVHVDGEDRESLDPCAARHRGPVGRHLSGVRSPAGRTRGCEATC